MSKYVTKLTICYNIEEKKEEDALQNLSKRDDIIITKADKGGPVVIVDVYDYIQEANRQLDNKEFYKKLTINTTEINRK